MDEFIDRYDFITGKGQPLFQYKYSRKKDSTIETIEAVDKTTYWLTTQTANFNTSPFGVFGPTNDEYVDEFMAHFKKDDFLWDYETIEVDYPGITKLDLAIRHMLCLIYQANASLAPKKEPMSPLDKLKKMNEDVLLYNRTRDIEEKSSKCDDSKNDDDHDHDKATAELENCKLQ